ncbi:MAG: hypothetical protein L0229_05275 [Blastocatellia bacterium]|nr:hypothetical protein [Blastocatellia bacterium]
MRSIILALTLIVPFSGLAQESGDKNPQVARARELLYSARAALGGERLKSLQSLSATVSYRRALGERQMTGEIEYDLLLPDKFMKNEIMSPIPGVEVTRIEAMNGEKIWTDSGSHGAGGGAVLIRQGAAADDPQAQARMEQAIRSEFARLLLCWLLTSPASFPVEFTHAGTAEAEDGTADVLEVKGPNDFAAYLFLDRKTHRPLMLSYKGRAPRVMTQSAQGQPRSREEIEKQAKEMRERAEAEPLDEIQIRFEDYRKVDGISLPHRSTRSINGEVNEEWEMKQFKVNPSIKPEKFEKK